MADQKLILNRYRLISAAGSGGFGTVQVAWDTRIQRRVAIKCIPLDENQAFRALEIEARDRYNAVQAAERSGFQTAALQASAQVGGRITKTGLFGGVANANAANRANAARGNAVNPANRSNAAGTIDTTSQASQASSSTPLAPHSMNVHLEDLPGLDEARTAAMLSDPTIVGVYDFAIQGSVAYLIMEYVDGMTLTTLLREYGSMLSRDAMAAIFTSVARALVVDNENQVLHLDIKPDNVLINRQGQVKVTDFGLATLSDASGFGSAGGGTIGYMPLEQMRQEPLDARCDEWALASLAYEMISGANPFIAPDLAKAEAAIQNAELVLPSLCRPDLNPAIDDVLFYALDPNRDERYDNVSDFAEEMARFLGRPTRGRKELATLVNRGGEGSIYNEDFVDEDEFQEYDETANIRPSGGSSLFTRLLSFDACIRVLSALGAGLAGFVAASNIEALAEYPVSGAVACLLCALLALVIPHAGVLLGLVALGAALCMGGAPVLGALVVVASPERWIAAGRRKSESALVAASPVLFGALGLNPFTPFLAGLFLPLRDAVISAAYALLISVTLAGFGSGSLLGWNALSNWQFQGEGVQATAVAMLAQPQNWLICVSWLAGAAVLALLCNGGRVKALLGWLLASMLILAGFVGAQCLSQGTLVFALPEGSLVPFVLATMTSFVLCVLGVALPQNDEEE